VTSSNGHPSEESAGSGDQSSPGGIPPSFGASSAPAPASPAPPAIPESQPNPATPPEPALSEPALSEPAPPESAPPEPVLSEPVLSEPVLSEPVLSEPILPELAPEPVAEPTVGWYPSAPAGPPTAGPFARPSTPARRGLGAFSFAHVKRPSSPSGAAKSTGSAGRTPSRTPAWRNRRSRLVNVAFFGIGPLVLAGVVVAAFLLVAPGKGSASSLGFQAGPGATAQSSASAPASPSASPSPAAHAKHRARSTPSSSVAKVPTIATAKPKPKTTPKPAHTSSGGGGGVTPHNLGLPNFAGYCHHIGDRTAELIASNAYGWRCTLNTAHVLEVTDVCAWTYRLSASQVVSVSANYSDPNAWQCWRINRDLGVLDFTNYCVAAALGTSELVAENAYGWYCTSPAAPVNTTAACDTVYHVNDAVSRFAVFADPYSWQCWN
jgi:hypothetical protein